jgi:hypothetical protein
MRELVIWWKARSTQLLVLCSFAIILVWQNIEMRREDAYFRKVVAEIRESFRRQETTRQLQFTRMLTAIEDHLSRIDQSIAVDLNKQSDPPVGEKSRPM